MCSLNHTTDPKKRLGCANPNLINQIQLNPQINENNQKYKNMKAKSKITVKKAHHGEHNCCINVLRSDHIVVPTQSLYHDSI
jgi:hypothetical protein